MNNEVLSFIRKYVPDGSYDVDMFCHDVKESKISYDAMKKLCKLLNLPFVMCLAELADEYKGEGQTRVLEHLRNDTDYIAERIRTVIVPLFAEEISKTSTEQDLILNVYISFSFQSYHSLDTNDMQLVLCSVDIGDKHWKRFVNTDNTWEEGL